MSEEIRPPNWVNAGYHRYHANRLRYLQWEEEAALEEEQGERVATPVELHEVGYWDAIEESTRVMRREDWVDRYKAGSRKAALGPALVSFAVIFVWVALIIAIVWFGAAWVDTMTPMRLP